MDLHLDQAGGDSRVADAVKAVYDVHSPVHVDQVWLKDQLCLGFRSPSRYVFQEDFCQQIFEVLVEVFRKESQNCLSEGQITKHCQPGEAAQREPGAVALLPPRSQTSWNMRYPRDFSSQGLNWKSSLGIAV